MDNCIKLNTPEFRKMVEESGVNPMSLVAATLEYMNNRGGMLPSLEDLGTFTYYSFSEYKDLYGHYKLLDTDGWVKFLDRETAMEYAKAFNEKEDKPPHTFKAVRTSGGKWHVLPIKSYEFSAFYRMKINAYNEAIRQEYLEEQDKQEALRQEFEKNYFESGKSEFDAPGLMSPATIDEDNVVNYQLKSINILSSDKAKQIFAKGEKAKWDLNKILTELQIPKEQKQLILDSGETTIDGIVTSLLANYSYTIEINTAKVPLGSIAENEERIDGAIEGENTKTYDYLSARNFENKSKYKKEDGWEYAELDITTPLISPSIESHAGFANKKNSIGWVRVWYNKKTGAVEIQEIQSDLFQKGRGSNNLLKSPKLLKVGDSFTLDDETYTVKNIIVEGFYEDGVSKGVYTLERLSDSKTTKIDERAFIKRFEERTLNTPENQFLQLLNKDNNWVTFFIKSIIQDSAKKGYEKVLFPKGETAAKIEGHETLADEIRSKDNKIKELENLKKTKEEELNDYLNNIDKRKTVTDSDINILKREIENIPNKIEKVNKEKQDLKTQGIEKLKPIEAFYEIKVGNILEKQFGKENVKTIIDEYGNEWREIEIDSKMSSEPILLSPSTIDEGMPFVEDPNIDFLFDQEVHGTKINSFQRAAKVKLEIIQNLQTKLNMIERDLKIYSTDGAMIQQLTREQDKINELLYGDGGENIGLLAEARDMATNTPTRTLEYFFQRDWEIIDTLKESTNPEDIDLVKSMLSYYSDMSPEVNPKDHPFFLEEDMFNENGDLILENDIVILLRHYANKANIEKHNILNKEKKILEDIFNTNPNVEQMSGGNAKSYKDIFYSVDGTKDINYFDMFLMDGQFGIFSTNPEVRQIMQHLLGTTIIEEQGWSKDVELKIDELQESVEKELKALGYDLKKQGFKGISYEIFRAKNEFGFYERSFTQRFTSKFFRARNEFLMEQKKKAMEIALIQDPVEKKAKYAALYQDKLSWYRNNAEVFDVNLLEDLNEEFGDLQLNYDKDAAQKHKERLISVLGEKGYKEHLEIQKRKIKEYIVSRDALIQDLLTSENVDEISKLSAASVYQLEKFNKTNNPFLFSQSFKDNTPLLLGDNVVTAQMRYNVTVPKRFEGEYKMVDGVFTLMDSDRSTGFYDDRFNVIENNEALYKFYEIIRNVSQKKYDSIPIDERDGYSMYDLDTLEKTLIERLYSAQGLEKIHEFWKWLMEKLRSFYTEKMSNLLTYNKINPITGELVDVVNSNFLKQNRDEIHRMYVLDKLRVLKAMGKGMTNVLPTDLELDTAPLAVIEYIAEKLNVAPSVQSIMSHLNMKTNKFNLASFVSKVAENEVVKNKSMDLPKILKLQSALVAEYAARQRILPTLKLMKEHYNNIKKSKTNKIGEPIIDSDGKSVVEGKRDLAIKQMDSWFSRAVLGNYNSKNEFGNLTMKEGKEVEFKKGLSKWINNKVYTRDEKLLIAQIDEQIRILRSEPVDASTEKIIENQIDELGRMKDNLGQIVSLTSMVDSVLGFIRWKVLGWNVSSGMTNFVEGQMANQLAASSGRYFPEEYLYKANGIVRGSTMKLFGLKSLVSPEVRKLSVLMQNYDILQDATNELQKASKKSKFNKLERLGPYEITKRIEYINQSPLFVAYLMNTKITGKDGTESSVWDAMQENGTLSDNFATPQNRFNWEILTEDQKADLLNIDNTLNRKQYSNTREAIIELIVRTHGDYNDLRGNMAKEYMTGKALMMFKNWITSYFFTRFAKEQDILALQVKNYKGRYRSMSASTGALLFAIPGLFMGGFVGLGIGIGVGAVGGKLLGIDTNLSLLDELGFTLKNVGLKMLNLPVQTLLGKTFIKQDWSKIEQSGMSETDVKNMRDLITEIAILSSITATMILVKAALYDDDDEEESLKRQAHNVLINKLYSLSEQSTSFLNGSAIYNLFNPEEIQLLRFATDVSKTAKAASDMLIGDDTYTSGPMYGDSKFANQFSKTFIPSPLKGNMGFGKAAERQFFSTPFDKMFWGTEKTSQAKVKQIRADYAKEIEEQNPGISKEERTKLVNKKYKPKKKKQTYEDLLEDYEGK